jgi:probable HAF family extracellular repeat protein
MVGVYRDAGGAFHGFLLDNGVVTEIAFPNVSAETRPTDINNRGQIVGGYYEDVWRHAFLLSDGVFTRLTPRGAFEDSVALGIDDRGRIVGNYF